MAHAKDGKEPVQPPGEVEVPLDTKLLSDAVIELNISRKNVGIYPPGHVQITRSIDRAFEILRRLFEIRAEMTLGVAKDTLFVGQDYLDRKNPVYRDFALSLNQQGIAAVTFRSGLEKEELIRFHRILTTRPSDIEAAGGISRVMADAELVHIAVTAIDYGRFHLTEEQEIAAPGKRTGEQEGAGLWQDFVSHLSAGTLTEPGGEEGVTLKDATTIDPVELARLLNERKLDPGLSIKSYDRVITSHVRAVAEKKELTREQSETLRSLSSLLKNLNPELRKQFLSVAFTRTEDASPAATEEVLGGLTDGMVVEMLQQANDEGREISPTLTGLLNKLSSVAGDRPEGRTEDRGTGPAVAERPPASPEQMRKLFDRERVESYVSPEYAEMLKDVAGQRAPAGPGGIKGFPIHEYTESLRDENLDFQIGRVALAFIDDDLPDDDYGEFLKKIVATVPGFLKTENFSILHDILETFRQHAKTKQSWGIRSMVDIALRTFNDPAFLSQAVDAFGMCSKDKVRAASGFLLSLGPDAVPLLLDQFALDETPGGRRPLFDLLCRFGNSAAQEAAKRLSDTRPAYVRNLLMLIRWGWDASATARIRPLLQHGDTKVRQEAVTALLRFKDRAAVPALREMIRSEDIDASSRAVKLAGQYRVSAVVDVLLSKIKKVILFETDYVVNEEIILALGEIGDPGTVPEFEKLARASWTLYPADLARMKVTLFESLERFPRGSIGNLLSIGERSGNDRIRLLCKRLRERP